MGVSRGYIKSSEFLKIYLTPNIPSPQWRGDVYFAIPLAMRRLALGASPCAPTKKHPTYYF
jgi:hypothetical protein